MALKSDQSRLYRIDNTDEFATKNQLLAQNDVDTLADHGLLSLQKRFQRDFEERISVMENANVLLEEKAGDGCLFERTINMELSETEDDHRILLENIVDVARLDEEVRGMLAQFEVADDETLVELKMKIKELESLRAEFRSGLEFYRKR